MRTPWSCCSPGCQSLLWLCVCCLSPSCRPPLYTGCQLHWHPWMCPVLRLQGFERSTTASPTLNTGGGFSGIDFGSARGRQLPWSSPLANISHFQLLGWSRPTELVWEAAALCIHYSQGFRQTLGARPGPSPGGCGQAEQSGLAVRTSLLEQLPAESAQPAPSKLQPELSLPLQCHCSLSQVGLRSSSDIFCPAHFRESFSSEKTLNPLPASCSAAQRAGSCLLWVVRFVLFGLPLVCFFSPLTVQLP